LKTRFQSPKATNIIARRESPGFGKFDVPTLKASNKSALIVARLQRADGLFAQFPAIFAGL
jgi:hypothetical protein